MSSNEDVLRRPIRSLRPLGRSPSLVPPSVGDYAVLQCPMNELSLQHTLASGQAFRWHRDRKAGGRPLIQSEPSMIILRCWQDREQLYYQTYPRPNNLSAVCASTSSSTSTSPRWRQNGAIGSGAGDRLRPGPFAGLRVTMQDPVECLFSFLCSSVAPIYRIRRGIDAMCRTLGVRVGEIGGREHFTFPRLEYMADAPRDLYDKMGLGFRGGNVKESAKEMPRARRARLSALSLRDMPYCRSAARSS